jgi:uncharacterized protein
MRAGSVIGVRLCCALIVHTMLACGMETPRTKFDWTQGSLAEGLRLYEAGEFFAAHEAWETVWLRAQEPEKMFLQGLIQVTAAFHHLQRNNLHGTALLLQAALGRLERYPARFGDISVDVLCNDIRAWLQALEAGEPPSELAPARIHP